MQLSGNSRRRRAGPAVLVLALALLAGGCGSGSRSTVAKHLILVTVDTWRADHAFAELAGQPLTPRLSELAAESTRFSRASSVAAQTTPGVTGFLTGLLPFRTGVLVNVHVVPPDVPTLATVLQGQGFVTSALVANPVLGPGNGFEHGFDHYRLLEPLDHRVKARAGALTDAALHELDRDLETGRRLFLWVHYLDPHGPYRPPEKYRDLFPVDRFGASPRPVALLERGDESGLGGIPAYQQRGADQPSTDARDYLARYAAEVRYMDTEVGRLVDGLRARGVLKESLLVLTADHGEALDGDHGFYFSHANGQTADQIHVPLMIRGPGCPRGQVIERPVSTVDILPTVLDRLGLKVKVTTDGIDLLSDRPRVVVSQGFRQVSLRKGRWKALWQAGDPPALYDLRNDPGENHNLAARRPRKLRELAHALRQVRQRRILARATVREHTNKRLRHALKALGYL